MVLSASSAGVQRSAASTPPGVVDEEACRILARQALWQIVVNEVAFLWCPQQRLSCT